MKKNVAIILTALMLLTLSGCGTGPVETTGPTFIPIETTIPGTVTQETIASEKLSVEMHPFYETLISTGFQYSRGELEYYSDSSEIRTSDVEFLYTGESNEIELATMDMTLNLPTDWMNRVVIYQVSADAAAEGSNNGYCYIINRDIIAANWGRESVSVDDLLGGGMVIDYICCLSAVSKDEYVDGDPREPEYAIYLGESDTHYYYMKTPDTQNPDGSELLHTRYALIDQIGEDAYWELVGDLVLTEDNIREMIVIHNQIDSALQNPDGYISVNEMIEGTGIELSMEGDVILLSEDGLTLELSKNSRIVYRNGYVAAVMKAEPVVQNGILYIHEDFYRDYFCKADSESVSLFHGVMFFPEEILAAIDATDASVFNQKVAAEVVLPTSMGIEAPHVDMDRAFQYRLLSEYPSVLAQELEGLGYQNASAYTYTEYVILSGAQTLRQVGITADMATGIQYDPNMTILEYHKQLALLSKTTWDDLTDVEKEFVTEKQISLSDWWHLHRVFDEYYQGEYMNQTDETLRATLIEYYEADISYLRSMIDTDSD